MKHGTMPGPCLGRKSGLQCRHKHGTIIGPARWRPDYSLSSDDLRRFRTVRCRVYIQRSQTLPPNFPITRTQPPRLVTPALLHDISSVAPIFSLHVTRVRDSSLSPAVPNNISSAPTISQLLALLHPCSRLPRGDCLRLMKHS
jgi:hypothetical protein